MHTRKARSAFDGHNRAARGEKDHLPRKLCTICAFPYGRGYETPCSVTLRHGLQAHRPVRLGARHGNLPFEVFHLRCWKSFIADGRMPNATATAAYPPPPWHTHGRAWAQPYLVDTRAFDLPPGFTPVTVACRALGILGLIEYLPPSPLTYAELVWMPCLVRAAGSRGFFVDKMYVDSEPSRAAGRAEWALPKQLAHFAITDTRATIDTEDGAHLVLDLRRRGPGVPVPISSGTLQHAGDHVVRFRGSGHAHLHAGSIHVVEAEGLGRWRGWSTARRIPAAGAALADFAITMHEPRTLG